MGGGGNDIIDGDAYLHVELLNGYAPGSQILREIRYDTALPTDIDTAVFNDVFTNYQIGFATSQVDLDGNGVLDDIRLAADGTPILQVTHLVNGVTPGADGTDLLFHVERLQFTDGTIDAVPFFADGSGNNHFLLPFVSGAAVITPDADPTTPAVELAAGTRAFIDTTGIIDANGIDPNTPFTVQWQMDDGLHIGFVDIANAKYTVAQGTADTTGFLVGDFQVGKTLRAMVSFTDGTGIREFTITAPTAIITADPTINQAPTIQTQTSPPGLPDTAAKANLEMSVPLPLLAVFTDDTTPANLLTYTATLADGSPLSNMGLTFSTPLDPAGLTGAEILNGIITGAPPPNYTGPIDIKITATDPGGLSVTDVFRINVLPNSANSPPVITSNGGGTSAAIAIDENTLAVTTLTAVDAQDPNAITYAIVGGADGALFTINAQTGELSFKAAPSFEQPADVGANNVYNLVVRAIDPQGKFDQQAIAVTVGNVDEAATGSVSIAGLSRAGVPANQVLLSAASTLADPDLPGGVVPLFSWLDAANVQLGTGSTLTVTAGATIQTIHLAASYQDAGLFGIKAVPDALETAIIGTTGGAALNGTAGNDLIAGFGGADTLAGGAGDDLLDGGAGRDTVTFAAATGPVSVDLAAGTATGEGTDTILRVENVVGSNFDDTITGSAANNVIAGGAGTDTAVFPNVASQQAFALNADGSITVTGQPVTPQPFALAGTDTLSSIETLRFAGIDLILRQGTNQLNTTETIDGTADNEIILGFDGNDILNGNDGDDVIYGGNGTDRLNGGNGDDTIVYTAGGDNNNPLSGRDIVNGGANATAAGDRYVLNGDATGETFHIYSAQAWLALGGAGHTLNNAQTQIVVTRGGTNNQNVISELRNIEEITVNTGAGNDQVLTHGSFAPTTLNQNTITISDGGGNDTVDITGQSSSHRIVFHTGDGADTLVGPVRAQDVVDTGGTFTQVQTGGAQNDKLTGSSHSDEIHGASGKDTISGGGGSDTLSGGDDDDWINGGAGDDQLYGGAGNDWLAAGSGNDLVDGGTGKDGYFASGPTGHTIIVDLTSGKATGVDVGTDTLRSIEYVSTGSGDDIVTGDNSSNFLSSGAGSDIINGMGGDDVLIAGSGNDKVYGGDGSDRLDAGAGDDYLDGGAGSDMYFAATAHARVTIDLANGTAWGADIGNDTIISFERAMAGDGDDALYGNSGANSLRGGAGDDIIDGRGGNDVVFGGTGDDTISVGSGNDIIVFEAGFGNDRIVDFDGDRSGGQDLLKVSSLGITAENFAAHVTITASGLDVLITIDGHDTIRLAGAAHSAPITMNDFILGS